MSRTTTIFEAKTPTHMYMHTNTPNTHTHVCKHTHPHTYIHTQPPTHVHKRIRLNYSAHVWQLLQHGQFLLHCRVPGHHCSYLSCFLLANLCGNMHPNMGTISGGPSIYQGEGPKRTGEGGQRGCSILDFVTVCYKRVL